MHFGIITPPVAGHLHPFGALGRELIRRGDRVTIFHMPDLEQRVRAESLEFVPIGESDHPKGTLPVSLTQVAKLQGSAALGFTIQQVRKTSEMMLRDAPAALRAARIDALLVDQMELAGAALAEHLDIPFVNVCNALLLNEEPGVPPPFTGWSYRPGQLPRLRNLAGYAVGRRVLKPIEKVVLHHRNLWKLPPVRHPYELLSRRAQICQLPPAFDFPRRQLPAGFHYVGPLRGESANHIPFPWAELDGRPLVYASLGTLQNRRVNLFRIFAEACCDVNLQLVITHGGGLSDRETVNFPGHPIVVSYAPQRQVLSRAALTLTHAGLNTVLDSLSFGVPLIAIPITYEQPAIASRVKWAGVGEVLSMQQLTRSRLRSAVDGVLQNVIYRQKAAGVQKSIAEAGGTSRAADIVKEALRM